MHLTKLYVTSINTPAVRKPSTTISHGLAMGAR